jgi:hypothetical protein
MADEIVFSSDYQPETSETLPMTISETSPLDMPGNDAIALGEAIVEGLKQYGTAKPKRQVIKAKIYDA